MKPTDTVPPSGRSWYALYSFLLILSMPAILLILLAKKRSRGGLLERLSVFSKDLAGSPRGNPVLWIHAVSMGEAMAIVPLVFRIKQTYPDSKVFVSTITDTGRDVVLSKLHGIAEHLYVPIDHVAIINRVLNKIHPHLFLCVDTELWPNLLRALQLRRIPTMLINGRLSSRSFGGYMKIRPFIKHVTRSISFCAMQSQRDVERMRALGANAERVAVVGNIKCDQNMFVSNPSIKESLGAFVRSVAREGLLVGASTHHGEEDALLAVYKRLLKEFPSLALLLVPRHLHRMAEVEATIRSHSFLPVRKTLVDKKMANEGRIAGRVDPSVNTSKCVLILDTHGDLASVFQFATVVWVGGSWVPVGGHNLIEPAQWGKPIVFGPYMDHVSEMAAMMVANGGGVQVFSIEEMTHEIATLLRDEEQRERMGNAARQVVNTSRGALDRTLEEINSILLNQPCRASGEKV